jgi:hypothetical protein
MQRVGSYHLPIPNKHQDIVIAATRKSRTFSSLGHLTLQNLQLTKLQWLWVCEVLF